MPNGAARISKACLPPCMPTYSCFGLAMSPFLMFDTGQVGFTHCAHRDCQSGDHLAAVRLAARIRCIEWLHTHPAGEVLGVVPEPFVDNIATFLTPDGFVFPEYQGTLGRRRAQPLCERSRNRPPAY